MNLRLRVAAVFFLLPAVTGVSQEPVKVWELGQENFEKRNNPNVEAFVEPVYFAYLPPGRDRHAQIVPKGSSPAAVRSRDNKKNLRALRIGTRLKFEYIVTPMILPEPLPGQWVMLSQIHGFKEKHDKQVGHQTATLRCKQKGIWYLEFRTRGDTAVKSGTMSEWSNPGVFTEIPPQKFRVEAGKPIRIWADITLGLNGQGRTRWWYQSVGMPERILAVDTTADNFHRTEFADCAGWDCEFGTYRHKDLNETTTLMAYTKIKVEWFPPSDTE